MNRIMKRPMFRKGGSAGEGITSGLAPRQGYQEAGSVEQFDLRNATMDQLRAEAQRQGFKAPPMAPDNSLRDFKIDFGLDLISRSPGGNIFQTAGAAAKDPFARFKESRGLYNKGINDRAINKYNSESDMFKTLIGAQADIIGEGGSTFKDLEIAKQLRKIMPRFIELRQKREDLGSTGGVLSKEEDLELRQLQEDYNRFSAKNLEDDMLIEIYAKSLGDRAIPKRVNELYNADLANDPRKYTSKDDPQIKKDAVESIRVELQNLRTYADGGRAGYANGELVEEQITETATMDPGAMSSQNMNTDNPISYDQLRARLPAEITDDIVELIANSAEALEDFAMISDQSQVDQFNRKYSVNLVLPAEA